MHLFGIDSLPKFLVLMSEPTHLMQKWPVPRHFISNFDLEWRKLPSTVLVSQYEYSTLAV